MEAYIQNLVKQASLCRHKGYQGVIKGAAATMVCCRAFHRGWLEAIF